MKKNLLTSAGIYTGSNIFNAAIPFILLPIYTRILSQSDYGLTTMFTLFVSFLIPFIGLNVGKSVNRIYFDKSKEDFAIFIYNILLILIVSTTIIVVIFLIVSNKLSSFTKLPKVWTFLIVLTALNQVINSIRLTVLQVTQQPFKYAIFSVSQALMNGLLSLVFVLFFELTWRGVLLGVVISSGFFAIISLYYLFKQKYIKVSFKVSDIKEALNFSVPLIPHTVAAIIIAVTDRLMVQKMLGVSATGLYAVGLQLSSSMALFTDSFNKAWVPYFFGEIKKDNIEVKKKIVKNTYLYFLFLTIVLIAIIAVLPLINNYYLGESFRGATKITIYLLIGNYFSGFYMMFGNYLFYTKKTNYLSYLTVFLAVLNIIMTYMFISLFGLLGAAVGTAISYFLIFIITWFISQRIFPMPWIKKV